MIELTRGTRDLLGAAFLLVITFIAFFPATRAQFIWDDPDYVTDNYNLRDAHGLANIWLVPRSSPQYYPLVHTSFWIEYQLWRLNPAGYHIDNILLHALAAILLWRVLLNLQIPGALLAAALFAIHPVQVESVAWVTERKNVLCGVFYFAAALAYLRYDERRQARPDRPSLSLYVAALCLFLCALLSKTVACSLPAAMLLLLWWKRGRLTRRDLYPLIPFFILGAALALVTAKLETTHVGAGGKEFIFTPLDRVLIASRAIFFYLGKLLLPIRLSFIYPRWTIDSHSPRQYLFPLAAAVLLLALALLSRRNGRGPLVAFLFFAGTLVPALGFINVYPMRYSFVADHFQYLAATGPIALFAALITRSLKRGTGVSPVQNSLPFLILVPLLVLTAHRTTIFHDPWALWSDTLQKNPNSWMVHMNFAHALNDAHDAAGVEYHSRRALELAPNLPETHWNIGINFAARGEFARALAEFDQAIALDPDFAQGYQSRGNVYLQQNDLTAARRDFEKAISLPASPAMAHFNLGIVLERQKDHDGALREFEAAVRANPESAEPRNYYARQLVRHRRFSEALFHYRQAIRIKPDYAEAHLNLGALLAALGQVDEARRELDTAVALDPNLNQYIPQILPR